jgi:hypothetical protein
MFNAGRFLKIPVKYWEQSVGALKMKAYNFMKI